MKLFTVLLSVYISFLFEHEDALKIQNYCSVNEQNIQNIVR